MKIVARSSRAKALWSSNELEFLSRNYKTCSNQELADVLGRTLNSVCYQLNRRGLVRREHRDAYIDDLVGFIPLHGKLARGRFAKVSLEDYERVAAFRWQVMSSGYAWTGDGRAGVPGGILMHRFILNPSAVEPIDHRNCDRLDNRRENIHVVTVGLNNQRIRALGKSGYKGVKRQKGRWISRIGVNHRQIHIGSYLTAEDAAHAYDGAALHFYGPEARLNFPVHEAFPFLRKA